MTHNEPPSTRILIVEDNKMDARLTSYALENLPDWPLRIEVVDDGEKAIHYLRRESAFAAAHRPDLVILDLNLPKYDGAEVLQVIRSTEDLRHLLVFVFSSSPADVMRDKVRKASVEADCYLEKPYQISSYTTIAETIRDRYTQSRLIRPDSAGCKAP